MRGQLRSHLWPYAALSLIVLSANTCAPFQTSGRSRAFLDGDQRQVATQSVIRVRGVSQAGGSLGYRAVVGLAKGGPDQDDSSSNSEPLPAYRRFPTGTSCRSRLAAITVARPTPPLRC